MGCVPVDSGVGDGPSGGGGGNIPNINNNGNNGGIGDAGTFAIDFTGQMNLVSNVRFSAELFVQVASDGLTVESFSIVDELGAPRAAELQGQIQILSEDNGTTFFTTSASDSGGVTATMVTSTSGTGLPPNLFIGPNSLVFNVGSPGAVFEVRVPSTISFVIDGNMISGSLDLSLRPEDPIALDIDELTGTFSGSRIN
jgi:hypothetical protein